MKTHFITSSNDAYSMSFKITLIYIGISASWILFSDHLLFYYFAGNPEVITSFQTTKGWFFVLTTAFLIYFLFQREAVKCKQAHEAITQAKEDWERTFNAVPDLIAILDDDYRIIRANRAMADKLGVTPDDAVGLTCYEHVHGADESPSYCPQTKSIVDGQEHLVHIHNEYGEDDFWVSTSALEEPKGEMKSAVHVMRGLSMKKKIEKHLKESEEKYRLLVQHAPAGIYEIDLEKMRFVNINNFMSEATGYTKEELMELDPSDLLTQESRKTRDKLLDVMFSGKQNPEPVEFKISGKNNRKFWVLFNSRVHFENNIPKKNDGSHP